MHVVIVTCYMTIQRASHAARDYERLRGSERKDRLRRRVGASRQRTPPPMKLYYIIS